jgi:hypothetical protein
MDTLIQLTLRTVKACLGLIPRVIAHAGHTTQKNAKKFLAFFKLYIILKLNQSGRHHPVQFQLNHHRQFQVSPELPQLVLHKVVDLIN